MRGLILKHVQKPMTRDQVCFLLALVLSPSMHHSAWIASRFCIPVKGAPYLTLCGRDLVNLAAGQDVKYYACEHPCPRSSTRGAALFSCTHTK